MTRPAITAAARRAETHRGSGHSPAEWPCADTASPALLHEVIHILFNRPSPHQDKNHG